MDITELLKVYSGQPITRQILMDLLRDYSRPYDKISELVKQKKLVQVKRGFFIGGPNSNIAVPENLLIANHLRGPSYVSSDTALSFWGLIPERVYETISMTTDLPKLYATTVGRFSYHRLPLPYYTYKIQRVEVASKQMVLMAGKEKALLDKIITTQGLKLRSVKQVRSYLMADLRISRDTLLSLNTQLMQDCMKHAPKRESLIILIKTLNNL